MIDVTWIELRELTPEIVRCDLCGELANTIHLVPWCDEKCEHALFACGRHCPQPEGYWFTVARWFEDDGMHDHLDKKLDPRGDTSKPGGLYLLLQRLEQLTRVPVSAEEEA